MELQESMPCLAWKTAKNMGTGLEKVMWDHTSTLLAQKPWFSPLKQ